MARSLREAREALKAGKTDAEAAIEREKAKQREAATSQKVRFDECSRQRETATFPTARCDERSTLLREIAELKADRKDAAAREAAALERARLHRAAMEKLKTDKDAESARADAAEAHARKALEMTETALERGEVLAFRHASLSACLSLSAVDKPLQVLAHADAGKQARRLAGAARLEHLLRCGVRRDRCARALIASDCL